jgi:hypothetical protein
MQARNMLRGNAACLDIHYATERVEPGVYFDSAFMAFIDHEYERVVIRRRASPLLSIEPFAPWLYTAFIKCIGRRAHLNYDCIEFIFLEAVDDSNEFLFLLLRGKEFVRGKIYILYGGNPNAAELSFRGW